MHIFKVYAILISFTVCRANYLTKDIYLQVCFSAIYIKKVLMYLLDQYIVLIILCFLN